MGTRDPQHSNTEFVATYAMGMETPIERSIPLDHYCQQLLWAPVGVSNDYNGHENIELR
jgi:hypothetical protein